MLLLYSLLVYIADFLVGCLGVHKGMIMACSECRDLWDYRNLRDRMKTELDMFAAGFTPYFANAVASSLGYGFGIFVAQVSVSRWHFMRRMRKGDHFFWLFVPYYCILQYIFPGYIL